VTRDRSRSSFEDDDDRIVLLLLIFKAHVRPTRERERERERERRVHRDIAYFVLTRHFVINLSAFERHRSAFPTISDMLL